MKAVDSSGLSLPSMCDTVSVLLKWLIFVNIVLT